MPPKPALDRIDRELLALLAKDGRLANKELAARVGLAPSSAHARVQRLLEEGYVAGFHAELDLVRLGFGLHAMISVQLDQATAIEPYAEVLLALPEVLEIYQVSGTEDLLVHVATRDTDHLRSLVMGALIEGGGVRHVETSIVFRHLRSHDLPGGPSNDD